MFGKTEIYLAAMLRGMENIAVAPGRDSTEAGYANGKVTTLRGSVGTTRTLQGARGNDPDITLSISSSSLYQAVDPTSVNQGADVGPSTVRHY